MNYARIIYNDTANGEGVRTTLFVSGCRHHCKGCFNQEAWDFNYGQPFTEEIKEQIIESLKPDYISGITFLGGEPLEPENVEELTKLAREIKTKLPNKTIWCYTGSLYEEVKDLPIMKYIDVLVDGPFVEELKDWKLLFRGSSNQRIIHLNS